MLSHMGRDEAEAFNQAVAAQAKAEASAAGYSVSKLARDAGMNRETLDRWLKGERPMSIPTLFQIAETIGIDPHLIITRAEERFEMSAALTRNEVALAAYEDRDWQSKQEAAHE